jgi:hypothetical protein
VPNAKDIPFSPPWQISNLEKPDQPEATELNAPPVGGSHAGADGYLIKRFDKNELLARTQVGLRILKLNFYLGKAGEGSGKGGWRNR